MRSNILAPIIMSSASLALGPRAKEQERCIIFVDGCFVFGILNENQVTPLPILYKKCDTFVSIMVWGFLRVQYQLDRYCKLKIHETCLELIFLNVIASGLTE